MRTMKDSGQEWLGTIPTEWGYERIGAHFSEVTAKNCDLKSTNALKFTNGRIVRKPVPSNISVCLETYAGYKLVHVNDIVINCLNLNFDLKSFRVGRVEEDGIITSAYLVIRPDSSYDPRFLDYAFKAFDYRKALHNMGSGIRKTLNWKEYKQYYVQTPDLHEQRCIADYLDKKCAEIDKAIVVAENSIAEYKAYWQSTLYQVAFCGLNNERCLVKGPVDYLNVVPSSWKAVKGKNVLRLLQRPVEDNDGVITCFRDGEVTLRTNRRTEGFTVALQEIGYQGIEPGDLVVHGMDGFAGAIGVSDSRGKASPVLIVMDSNQNKRFLMYYLRAIASREVFLALADGIRVRSCNLSWKKLGNLVLVLPELTEQEEIAAYLDNLHASITRAIATKQSILEDLKSYKQSLIYEVVTGKREV